MDALVTVGEDEETESEEEEINERPQTSKDVQNAASTPSQNDNVSHRIPRGNGVTERDQRLLSEKKKTAKTESNAIRADQSSSTAKTNKIKQRIIKIVPSHRSKPQLKEVKSRSKLDIVRSGIGMGFGNMLKSGKKMVEKNFNAPKRGKWERVIHEATTAFHEKTVKAVDSQLSKMTKQTEKCKSECEQCITHLHNARVSIQKANQNLVAFCDDDEYQLVTLY